MGNADAASADAARGVKLFEQTSDGGTLTTTVGRAYLTLANARHTAGQELEARAAAATAVRHLERALGPSHPATARARALATAAVPRR